MASSLPVSFNLRLRETHVSSMLHPPHFVRTIPIIVHRVCDFVWDRKPDFDSFHVALCDVYCKSRSYA